MSNDSIGALPSSFQPLTPNEKKLYSKVFKSLDPEKLGLVTGEVAGLTFEKSGLDSQTLYQIWELADAGNNGFLRQLDFIRAMRLIGHVQSGKALSPDLADIPAPAPKFQGLHFSLSPASTGQTSSSANNNLTGIPATGTGLLQPQFSNSSVSNAQQLPPITATEITKFIQLFNRHVSPSYSSISGLEAREIFLKAKLPENVLGLIWNLADRGGKGSLSKDEFCLAMFLIQSLLKGVIKLVPVAIPEHVWSEISHILISTNYGTTGQANSIQQQSTGNLLGLGSSDSTTNKNPIAISSSASGAAVTGNVGGIQPRAAPVPPQRSSSYTERPSSADSATIASTGSAWIVTLQQKQQFDQIFDSLDKARKGSLGPGEVAPFLMSSKLSQDDLAKVWDLSDINNSGDFSKLEFSISMFLVQKKLRGEPLPATIPVELIESVKKGGSASATNVAAAGSPSQQFAASNPPTLPAKVPESAGDGSRGIAPPPPPPQQRQSSLNDLVGIFGSSPSPSISSPSQATQLQPTLQQTQPFAPAQSNTTGNSLTSHDSLSRSLTGTRKFKPSSNFGQQIIHEQEIEEQKKSSLLQFDDKHDDNAPEDDSGDDSDVSYSYSPENKRAPPPIPSSQKPNYDVLRDISTTSANASPVPASASTGQALPPQQPSTHSYGSSAPPPPPPAARSLSHNTVNLNNQLNQVNNQITQEHVEVGNLTSQIKSIESQSTELQEKISNSQKQLAAVREAKGTYVSRLNQVRALLEEETEQYEAIKKSVIESQQENESLRHQSSVLEAQYNDHQTQYQSYQSQLTEKQNENAVFKEKLGTLNGEHSDLLKRLENIKKALQEQIQFNAVQERQLEVLNTKNVSLKSDIEKAQKELESAKAAGATKEKEVKEAEAHLNSLSASLENNTKALSFASEPSTESTNGSHDKNIGSIASTAAATAAGIGGAVAGAVGLNKFTSDTADSGRSTPVKKNNPFLSGFGAVSNENKSNASIATPNNDSFTNATAQPPDSAAAFDFPAGSEQEHKEGDENPLRKSTQDFSSPNTPTTEEEDEINAQNENNKLENFTDFPSHEDFERQFIDDNLKSPTDTEKATTVVTKETSDTSPPTSDFQFGMQNNGILMAPYNIPRPDSLTSSVQNNAPLSVRGDIDEPVPESPNRTNYEPFTVSDNTIGGSSAVNYDDNATPLIGASNVFDGVSNNTESSVPEAGNNKNADSWFENLEAPKDFSDDGAPSAPDTGERQLSSIENSNLHTSSITNSVSDDEFTDAKEDLVFPTFEKHLLRSDGADPLNNVINSGSNNNNKPNLETFDATLDNLDPAAEKKKTEKTALSAPFSLENKSASTLLDGQKASQLRESQQTQTQTESERKPVDFDFDDFDNEFSNLKPAADETPQRKEQSDSIDAGTIKQAAATDDFDATFDDLSPTTAEPEKLGGNESFDDSAFDDLESLPNKPSNKQVSAPAQTDFDAAFGDLGPTEASKPGTTFDDDDFDADFENLSSLQDKQAGDLEFDDNEFSEFDSKFPDLNQGSNVSGSGARKASGDVAGANVQANEKANDNEEFDSAFNI